LSTEEPVSEDRSEGEVDQEGSEKSGALDSIYKGILEIFTGLRKSVKYVERKVRDSPRTVQMLIAAALGHFFGGIVRTLQGFVEIGLEYLPTQVRLSYSPEPVSQGTLSIMLSLVFMLVFLNYISVEILESRVDDLEEEINEDKCGVQKSNED
jgi:hypothetical protein